MFRFTKRSKYRNQKCTYEGHSFDSLGEMNYYKQLKLREFIGEITVITLQEKIYLTKAKILYKPDFTVLDINGSKYWIDYKGFATSTFQIKKRLWKFYGPGTLHIVKGNKVEVITSFNPIM